MRSKLAVAALGALLSVSLIGVSSASAATEFGDNCVANLAAENPVAGTAFSTSAPGNPLPLTAPTGGVITRWKLSQNVSPTPFPQALKVLRITSPLSVQVIGESAQTVNPGLNTFETRIPVQAGDRLGLFGIGTPGIVLCETPGSEARLAVFEGPASVGSNTIFTEFESVSRIPVAAIVEPDADNDGFGDETQDKCPQSAATQAACPPIPLIELSASSIARKGLVTILVTSPSQAPVTVTGTAKVGKGKTAKLNGGTQVVAPGAIARFTLLFPKSLKSKLKQLRPKRKLTLRVTATAVNAANQPSTTSLKVRVKGQKKKQKGRAKPKKGRSSR